MEIIAKKGDILASEAELTVVAIFENEDWDNEFLRRIDNLLSGKLKKLAKSQNFIGKIGERLVFPAPDGMTSEFVLVVGAGAEKNLSSSVLREIAGLSTITSYKLGTRTIAIEFVGEDDEQFDAKAASEALAEGFLLADYQFITYKKKKDDFRITSATIIAEDGRDARKAERAIEQVYDVYEGVRLARDLVNTPGKDMTPHVLATRAEEIAKKSNGRIRTRVFDKEQCARKKMNAFLAVAQGSDEDPAFIHLTYTPEKPAKKSIALVGKGVTFDSGGLSIKPGNLMETMKCDMAGAAVVLGVFEILAKLQPNIEIHGIIAATENMPSGKAIRPGDIVRASNGKTIEILNTDAEGRLTLADALIYASKLEPDFMIDLATLTGACVVALGEEITGLMANDDELATMILKAAAASGESTWRLPLEQSYVKLLESDIADVRNISTSRYGGALTAGLFLQQFIPEGVKWAHLDIAGPAFAERPISSYVQKGGTGFGVRTIIQFIQSF
ncbi:MAG: leucyl aminopeptidase [Patescibacteria group bacterium]